MENYVISKGLSIPDFKRFNIESFITVGVVEYFLALLGVPLPSRNVVNSTSFNIVDDSCNNAIQDVEDDFSICIKQTLRCINWTANAHKILLS